MAVVLERRTAAAEYTVRDGDTLDKIAKDKCPELGWQVLARYNWGTSIPKEVLRALCETVGVAASELATKAANPETLALKPDPDLAPKLKIPKEWQAPGLAVEKTHVVNVSPIKPANAVSITALDKWFIPELEHCEIKYSLDGPAKTAHKLVLEVYGSNYCECTDWSQGRGTYGSPLADTPVFEKDLASQAAERQSYDKPIAEWKGEVTTTQGMLGRKTGAAAKRHVSSAFSPYTAHFRYFKADGDKKARLTLEPFWPTWDETKTEHTDANIDHAGVKKAMWTNAAPADRGIVRIKDKAGQLVHAATLAVDQLAAGAKELAWDGKYRGDAMNSKLGAEYIDDDKPYAATITTLAGKPRQDSLKIKWKLKNTHGKCERGLLQITDRAGKLVFQKALAKAKLADGGDDDAHSFQWDGKYAKDIKNSTGGEDIIPQDMPYRVQIQAHSGVDVAEGLALAAMHTEVRLYVNPNTAAPDSPLYDPWLARKSEQSLLLAPGHLVPGDSYADQAKKILPAEGSTQWYRLKLAQYGFHPGPVTDASAADDHYKTALLEFKRSVPENGKNTVAPNFKRLLIGNGSRGAEENAKTLTAIKNIRDTDKRALFGDPAKVKANSDTPDLSDAEAAALLPDPAKEMIVWVEDRQYYTQDLLAGGGKDDNNRLYFTGTPEAEAFGLKNYRGPMSIGDNVVATDAAAIARPWLPMRAGLVLLSRTQELSAEVDVSTLAADARESMQRAIGPLRVDWAFDEIGADISVIDPAGYDNAYGRARRYVAWQLDKLKSTYNRKDTKKTVTYTNCLADLGGIRPAAGAAYHDQAFGVGDLKLAPWEAAAVAATDSIATVVHDHIAAAQKLADSNQSRINLFEPLLGSAGVYFNPSRIAGDGYRLRAEVQFQKFAGYDFPNLKALESRYPVRPQAHSARLRLWRKSSIRGFASWASPDAGNWPGFLDGYRKHYRGAHVYFVHEGGTATKFAVTDVFDPSDNTHATRYKNIVENNLTDANLKGVANMTLKAGFVWPWDDQNHYGYNYVSFENMPDGDVYKKFLSDQIMESTWGKFSQGLLFGVLRETEKRGFLRGHLLVEFKSSGRFHLREYSCDGNTVPAGATPAPPHRYWSCEKGPGSNAALRNGQNCAFPNCKRVVAPTTNRVSRLTATGRYFEYDHMPLWAEGRALGATWLFNSNVFPAIWTHEVGHHRHLQHAADAPGAVLDLHDSEANEHTYPPNLTANFTASAASGSAPLSVTFTDTSTGGTPAEWLWEFGDGAYSTAQNPTHVYTSAGTRTVKLTVANARVSNSKTATVTVTGTAKPTANFTASTLTGTLPLDVTFTDTSTGGAPTQWLWLFGDGASDTSQNPTHRYSKKGTFTVILVATNDHGAALKNLNIVVNAPALPAPTTPDPARAPGARFTASPLTGVAPFTVTLTDTSVRGPSHLLWDFGDQGFELGSGGAATQHTYDKPGTYTVALAARNDHGQNRVTKVITVTGTAPALPDPNYSVDTVSGAAPLTCTFTDTSTNTSGWLWWFADGTASTSQNPTHVFDTPGTYGVQLHGRNANGEGWSAKVNVTVSAPAVRQASTADRLQWDRRCIMGYSHMFGENEEYFCGRCILRNRGWRVRGLGAIGTATREP